MPHAYLSAPLRWPTRLFITAAAALALFCTIVIIRSFYVQDTLSCYRLWIAPNPEQIDPEQSETIPPDPAVPYRFGSRVDLFSEGGVLTLQLVTSTPWPIDSQDTIEPEMTQSGWDHASRPAEAPRSRSDGPETYFEGFTEWRIPWLGLYSWAHMAYHVRVIEVPHWCVILLLVAPAAALVARHGVRVRRRSMRQRSNCCVGCGYDLSGSPSGAPCPECGRQ